VAQAAAALAQLRDALAANVPVIAGNPSAWPLSVCGPMPSLGS
jgi:hypothetical protein